MTNAEARFSNSLRPRKPEGSLGWTAQDGHLDSHTGPELCMGHAICTCYIVHEGCQLLEVCVDNRFRQADWRRWTVVSVAL